MPLLGLLALEHGFSFPFFKTEDLEVPSPVTDQIYDEQ